MNRKEVPHDPVVEGMLSQSGALPGYAIAAIRNDKGIAQPTQELEEPQSPYSDILEGRPRINAPMFLADLKVRWDFREQDGAMQIVKDVIGMVRKRFGGPDETYEQKLKAEEDRGHTEAASYGTARIHGHDAVVAGMHWDFFAGSLGVVVGEKIMKAAQLGTRRQLPLITFFTSGGARQQENFPGLVQMARTTHAIESHRKKSKRVSVGVALHQTWGGVSASAFPRMHITAVLRGTDHGFTGKRVIESYTYEPVPDGAQTGEMSVRQRSLDLVVNDADELDKWLGGFLAMDEAMYKIRGKNPTQAMLHLPHLSISQYKQASFENQGFILPDFASPLIEVNALEQEHIVFSQEQEAKATEEPHKTLFEQYQTLRKDARRPDMEYILANAFTDVVPLYSKEVEEDVIRNPAIGAALAKIGDQPFLIIGNLPSYQRIGETVNKIPSSPGPEDFLYMQRMLKFGEELGYPVIFLTDTLGAKPTLAAEYADQSRRISDSIAAGLAYPHPVISIVIGGLGSGGGMATTPMGDHVAMLAEAMAFVAEPVSAASILYNKPNPDMEEVEATINSMRATAIDQLDLKLIDAVIPEPTGGAEVNPLQAVENLRDHIAKVAHTLLGQSNRRRLKNRDNRIENLRGFQLKGGNAEIAQDNSSETVVI